MDTKYCPRCDSVLSKDDFHKNSKRHDGLDSYCAECKNSHKREWSKTRRKELTEYNRVWREKNAERYLWNKAKNRAKSAGLEFSIEISDINIPTNCPVLGIPIYFPEKVIEKNGPSFTPNSPSIDRLDNNKGYTKDNIVVVSTRANLLKRDGTLEEFSLLVKFLNSMNNKVLTTEYEEDLHCW